MEEVRNPGDNELCGQVERRGERRRSCASRKNASRVTVARGYYAMPGVPTLSITAQQLAAGEWEMLR